MDKNRKQTRKSYTLWGLGQKMTQTASLKATKSLLTEVSATQWSRQRSNGW